IEEERTEKHSILEETENVKEVNSQEKEETINPNLEEDCPLQRQNSIRKYKPKKSNLSKKRKTDLEDEEMSDLYDSVPVRLISIKPLDPDRYLESSAQEEANEENINARGHNISPGLKQDSVFSYSDLTGEETKHALTPIRESSDTDAYSFEESEFKNSESSNENESDSNCKSSSEYYSSSDSTPNEYSYDIPSMTESFINSGPAGAKKRPESINYSKILKSGENAVDYLLNGRDNSTTPQNTEISDEKLI
ncbi:hypothetical protein NEAUS03_1901, partial [Nematocida ausubeli]